MIQRRQFAKLAATGVSGAWASSALAQTAQPKTFVLIHGAWHGGWCWRRVADLLRAEGHKVFAPTLTGLGERSHLMSDAITLETHVQDIVNVFKYEDLRDVTLVGHSYGGMVITGAADLEIHRIAGMIYIDAFLPENGQSLWDLAGAGRAAVQQATAKAHDGGFSLPRGPSPRGSAPDSAARFDHLFTPQPVGCLSEAFQSCRQEMTWPARHYALCTGYDPSPFQAIARRIRRESGWTYSEFDALHDVVRTHPAEVAACIQRVIADWTGSPTH